MIPGDTIVPVSGFGRCGTSLVMQMLCAGGAEVSGTYPSYEESCGGDFVAEYLGRAVKVLSLESVGAPLPPGPIYKCIWLNRDPKQQARSMLKVASSLHPNFNGNTRAARKQLALSYVRRAPLAIAKLRSAGADILQWNFEDILEDPLASARAFAAHLGLPLDLARMADVPRARGAESHPSILEVELMTEARGGSQRRERFMRPLRPNPPRSSA